MLKRQYLIFLSLAFSAMALLGAETVWVKNTFQWRGNGVLITGPVPIHGDAFRLRCSSAGGGPLTVIVENEDGSNGKTLLERQRLDSATTRRYGKRADVVRFRIVGDIRGWKVELDQLMDTVQEWRYRRYLADRPPVAERKVGQWSNRGSQDFTFTVRQAPCRLQLVQEGESNTTITVKNAAGELLFQSSTLKNGAATSGSLHSAGEVFIAVSSGDDTAWTLSAFGAR